MSATYRFEIVVEIDEELLAEHHGEKTPPPNDIADWNAADLFAAAELGIVDRYESDLIECTKETV